MDTYTAVMICEGAIEADSDEHGIEAWQYLIDTGLVWQLQGFFGRTAHDLIQSGICTPPVKTKQEETRIVQSNLSSGVPTW